MRLTIMEVSHLWNFYRALDKNPAQIRRSNLIKYKYAENTSVKNESIKSWNYFIYERLFVRIKHEVKRNEHAKKPSRFIESIKGFR